MSGMPQRVRITEVAPRDGFQSIKPWIDTELKISCVKRLFGAGADMVEACSFVSPKAIPQMKDAGDIAASLAGTPELDRAIALVPNAKGADLAAAAGMKNIAVVISASADHNMSNVRKTPAQSLEELKNIRAAHPQLHIKLDVATAFGCPFKGDVSLEEIRFVLEPALEMGIYDICLCDTIGVASPTLVRTVLGKLMAGYADKPVDWSVHFHNTRGLAAVNTMVALELGVDRFETAFAGLGGCPFAPGASGNMATEDLIYLLNELGIHHGMELDRVLAASEDFVAETGCCRDSKIDSVTKNKVFKQEDK